jgi:broad specificity phosphatase PhoE
VRLFLISRHGESTLNTERRVNGDPSVAVDLTQQGEEEARALGVQIANVPVELCVHTRFSRTRRTGEIALEGRDVPFVVEPLLDDIKIGELEGQTIDDYRDWKAEHARSDPFPGGESLDDAGHRYAQAFRNLLARPEQVIFVVTHEIPIRYALNSAAGSDDLDGPMHAIHNATPYLFDEPALELAARRTDELVG